MPEIVTAPAPASVPASAGPNAAAAPVKQSTSVSSDSPGEKTAQAAPGQKLPESAKVDDVKKDVAPEDPNKHYTIKVEGKEYNLSKDEVVKLTQKGFGAERKFQEAHNTKTQVNQFLHLLKTDPMSILTNPKVGIDFKKLAREYLAKEIEKEMMTPEQRELHDTKEKLMAAENEKKQAELKQQQERDQALLKHSNEYYEKDIQSALENSGLPKTRGTVKRIAYYLAEGLKRGVEFKAADVTDLVRKDYITEISELFGSADGDSLVKLLGDPNIKKINETLLKNMNQPPKVTALPNEAIVVNGNSNGTKLSKDEWRAQLDKRFGK